eukprot:m51a1_g14657 hypothetical protein (457) ;mRNA; f:154860-156702
MSVSERPRKEITHALKRLGPALVRETLHAHALANASKPITCVAEPLLAEECLKLIVRCSLTKFVRTLRDSQRDSLATCLGCTNLLRALESLSIDDLVQIVTTELLKEFSVKLNLPTEHDRDSSASAGKPLTRDELQKHVADELMLIGMEQFLLELPDAKLKEIAAKLKLSVPEAARHEYIVEVIMVDIFQLEPLPSTQAAQMMQPAPAPAAAQAPQAAAKPKKASSRKSAASPASASASAGESTTTTSSRTPKGKEREQQKDKDRQKDRDDKEKARGSSAAGSRGSAASSPASASAPSPAAAAAAVGETAVPMEEDEDPTKYMGHLGPDGKWVSPPIESIVRGRYNKQTLHDNFCLPELAQYCKLHGVPGRKKPEMIKNILLFLDGHDFSARRSKKGSNKKRAAQEGGGDGEPDAKRRKTEEGEGEDSGGEQSGGGEEGGEEGTAKEEAAQSDKGQ